MKTFTLSSEGVLARYDYLSRLSPDRWAWEYARRNPDLRRDAEARSDDDVSEMKAPCADIRLLKPRNPQRLAHRWGLEQACVSRSGGSELLTTGAGRKL